MARSRSDVPTISISELKRPPMAGFQKADQETMGVYVFNREKIAGIILTERQYESLNRELEELRDQLADLKAEKRLVSGNAATFSDVEVRGRISARSPAIDEEDGGSNRCSHRVRHIKHF